jgi:hypothetical protein
MGNIVIGFSQGNPLVQLSLTQLPGNTHPNQISKLLVIDRLKTWVLLKLLLSSVKSYLYSRVVRNELLLGNIPIVSSLEWNWLFSFVNSLLQSSLPQNTYKSLFTPTLLGESLFIATNLYESVFTPKHLYESLFTPKHLYESLFNSRTFVLQSVCSKIFV